MDIRVNKKFLKELSMLPIRERSKIEKFLFEEAETYENLKQVPSIGKLQGYHNFYKIRFGNYRAGVRFENNTLFFERLLHRKDIYKFYPGK